MAIALGQTSILLLDWAIGFKFDSSLILFRLSALLIFLFILVIVASAKLLIGMMLIMFWMINVWDSGLNNVETFSPIKILQAPLSLSLSLS